MGYRNVGSESCIVDEDLVQGLCEIVQGTSVIPYLQNLQSLEQAVSRMSLASIKMGGDQPYLATGPKGLLESCDVLLKLDGGSELPAHSQVLARCMSVVSDMMVAGGPLAKASAEDVVRVPFGECSLEEASRFLSAIYSSRASEHIDEGSALSIAQLSHKYGGEDLLKMCDKYLAKRAGINIEPPEEIPAYLQGQEPESFMDIMKSASLYSMPKLLACCEYRVALSAVCTLHSELRALCAKEPLLAGSWSRTAEAFAITIYRVNGPTILAKCEIAPCKCSCCEHRKSYNPSGCKCTDKWVTTRKLVPSPKEFLEMAAAAEKPQ